MQYYQRAWNNIPVFKTTHSIPVTSISVIISARNEEKNIESLLYSLEQQSYPKNLFELIIVDDYSEDDTWNMLAQYQDPSFSTIFVKLSDHSPHEENIKSHKKKAIETGIRLSRGGLIVTTDADCIFPVDWLQTLAYYYESTNAKFIAAPVKIAGNTSLLSIFQTLDFITLQGITGASVYKNIHSMCNGANLAYEKKSL